MSSSNPSAVSSDFNAKLAFFENISHKYEQSGPMPSDVYADAYQEITKCSIHSSPSPSPSPSPPPCLRMEQESEMEPFKTKPKKREKVEFISSDDSVVLIIDDDILFFETEEEADNYAISRSEYQTFDPSDEKSNTCPFIVKMSDVDIEEYRKRISQKNNEFE